jgi:NodT family efflux transporter outer membrane factor (OMF) lipoprotein
MRRAIAAACVVILSGCMAGPRYHRPDAPAPPAFKEAPPEGWKQAQPNEAIPRGRWWEIYNDPALNDLETQITISNQNVLAAMARYREARDQVRVARASLFPTVTTTPAVTRSRTSGTFARGSNVVNAVSGGTLMDYTLPVDVSYQADVWGNIRGSVRAASATAQASAADLENAGLTIQAQLAQMYFQLHGLDGDANLLQTTLALFQQSLQLTQDRFNVGVASGADVAQAETQLATTRAQLIDIGVARAQFEHAIATLIGRAPSEVSIPAVVLSSVPPSIPVGLPSALLERRPDIAAMERTIAAANEQIGISKAAFFPSVLLNASGGFETSNLAQWFTWPSRFWSVGPRLAETLFDGGKRKAQVDLAEAVYDESVANYRETVLTALQQVEDQLSGLRILEQEAQAQADAIRAAQQTLDIVTAQYTAGTTDYLQVITAQSALLQNQRAAIDVLTRRQTASVLLIEALGGGWNAAQLPAP